MPVAARSRSRSLISQVALASRSRSLRSLARTDQQPLPGDPGFEEWARFSSSAYPIPSSQVQALAQAQAEAQAAPAAVRRHVFDEDEDAPVPRGANVRFGSPLRRFGQTMTQRTLAAALAADAVASRNDAELRPLGRGPSAERVRRSSISPRVLRAAPSQERYGHNIPTPRRSLSVSNNNTNNNNNNNNNSTNPLALRSSRSLGMRSSSAAAAVANLIREQQQQQARARVSEARMSAARASAARASAARASAARVGLMRSKSRYFEPLRLDLDAPLDAEVDLGVPVGVAPEGAAAAVDERGLPLATERPPVAGRLANCEVSPIDAATNERNLAVRPASVRAMGRGLFAVVDFARCTTLAEYRGFPRTKAEIDQLYGNGPESRAPYATVNGLTGQIIDASTEDPRDVNHYSVARYANDCLPNTIKYVRAATDGRRTCFANAVFLPFGARLYLVAIADIPAGREIFVKYGDEYWKGGAEAEVRTLALAALNSAPPARPWLTAYQLVFPTLSQVRLVYGKPDMSPHKVFEHLSKALKELSRRSRNNAQPRPRAEAKVIQREDDAQRRARLDVLHADDGPADDGPARRAYASVALLALHDRRQAPGPAMLPVRVKRARVKHSVLMVRALRTQPPAPMPVRAKIARVKHTAQGLARLERLAREGRRAERVDESTFAVGERARWRRPSPWADSIGRRIREEVVRTLSADPLRWFTPHEMLNSLDDATLSKLVAGTCQARNVVDRLRNKLVMLLQDAVIVRSPQKMEERPEQRDARAAVQRRLRRIKPELCGRGGAPARDARPPPPPPGFSAPNMCPARPARFDNAEDGDAGGGEFCGPTPSHSRLAKPRLLDQFRLNLPEP